MAILLLVAAALVRLWPQTYDGAGCWWLLLSVPVAMHGLLLASALVQAAIPCLPAGGGGRIVLSAVWAGVVIAPGWPRHLALAVAALFGVDWGLRWILMLLLRRREGGA